MPPLPVSLGTLLAELNYVELITHSKGVVLGVVIILFLFVALTVFVVFYKLIHVSMAQAQSITFLNKFWDSKRLDDIYRVAEQLKYSPIAAMFRAGYIELSKVKKAAAAAQQQGDTSMHEKMGDSDNVERALARARTSEQTKLENLLPFLATTGSAAPFVGLFGTVWGIMDAFAKISEAGKADLASVAGPIAEALIATALALASAVPAVVLYNYFQRRLKVLGAEMQNFGNDFMNIVKRHFF
ncbi:MAG: MotA/TolQ/ExbB proton channel family protein [Deltaproteobacteria bacterium]|nr:MotA/TolQ/ExbB proton channel family protein [Deltaproteobacteria bacterium]MBK8234991.1 MotA/TolQ/ExbB proton channel family protein [Deltaproteobacteria bacterium]MBK8716697.1 MotA/TolQ/ExbB proton channel family protein [Deltaproteobacteria bacterium]MBP7285336.1 MotA/TolQ/ExbB proton channel family protein [Nannocystaceae bacterium]